MRLSVDMSCNRNVTGLFQTTYVSNISLRTKHKVSNCMKTSREHPCMLKVLILYLVLIMSVFTSITVSFHSYAVGEGGGVMFLCPTKS